MWQKMGPPVLPIGPQQQLPTDAAAFGAGLALARWATLMGLLAGLPMKTLGLVGGEGSSLCGEGG